MRDDFTNQLPRTATEKDTQAPWGCGKPGELFRCHLCGHKFQVGDYWRWIYTHKTINIFACQSCDGEDVLERWYRHHEDGRRRFWWMA